MPPGWSDASLVDDLSNLQALRDEGVIICDACANKKPQPLFFDARNRASGPPPLAVFGRLLWEAVQEEPNNSEE